MKLTTISGIIGTLCIILAFFIFQTKEEFNSIVFTISICVVLIEGIILMIYAICKDD